MKLSAFGNKHPGPGTVPERTSPFRCRIKNSVDFHMTKVRNLVDPASGRMLVSKIKPCKSKYMHCQRVKLQMAHYASYNVLDRSDYLHG